MAVSIGALTFDYLRGRPSQPAPAVQGFERLGENGGEYRLVGARESDVVLTSLVTAASAAAAQTAAEGQRAIRGTIVTVTDVLGTAHTNCLVVDCAPRIVPVSMPTPNVAHTHAVVTNWTIRKLYTAP